MKSRDTLKTLVIGLDGATFDLMMPLIEQGELPNLASLLEKGAWGELESTIPPVTAAAWPSFMTGENPGKHGILKFVQGYSGEEDNKSSKQVVTATSFAGRTFFDVMKLHGRRSAAITIPMTYPPWDINGIMISGFPCPDNNRVYMASSAVSIDVNEPLNFEADYYKTASEEQILEDCLYRDKLRSELTLQLLRRYEFDCLTVVFGGIDRASHDYWKYHDRDFPGVSAAQREEFGDSIVRNYKLADREIGSLFKIFRNKANIFIVSDHGSGRTPFYAFNANVWLRENGMLAIKTSQVYLREIFRKAYRQVRLLLTPRDRKSTVFLQRMRQGADNIGLLGTRVSEVLDWEKTQAFYYPLMYPADGIMLNLKGRQSRGIVDPGEEKERLVNQIIEGLLKYSDPQTGEPIVNTAYRSEDLYAGPFASEFPDVVYLLNRRCMGGKELVGDTVTKLPVFRLLRKSGFHQMNGVFIAHGPKIKPARLSGARIIDVAPTILYCSGLPVPETMDGIVLQALFAEQALDRQPVEYFKFRSQQLTDNGLLDEFENEQMKEKLKSLGYID